MDYTVNDFQTGVRSNLPDDSDEVRQNLRGSLILLQIEQPKLERRGSNSSAVSLPVRRRQRSHGRRSKSVEPRRKPEKIGKPREELDFGSFTLLAKPKSIKSFENLGKIKSLPNLTETSIKELSEIKDNNNNSVPSSEQKIFFKNINKKAGLLEKQTKISRLEIGKLFVKSKSESNLLAEQTDILEKAQEVKTSCEDLLDDFQEEQEIFKTTFQDNTTKFLRLLELSQYRCEQVFEENDTEKKQLRTLQLEPFDSNLKETLVDQGLSILKKFIRDLIIEDKIKNIEAITSYFETNESNYCKEEGNMYQKTLKENNLGIERTSSMPEMTRQEFLEKSEQQITNNLKRNKSFGSNNDIKKTVIKTKVSSRLLQNTAASSGKLKAKIPYTPPAKKADPQWTDRPLRNVDSGYTSQTYIKYHNPKPPRNLIESTNEIKDQNEVVEWGTPEKSKAIYGYESSDNESIYKFEGKKTQVPHVSYTSDAERDKNIPDYKKKYYIEELQKPVIKSEKHSLELETFLKEQGSEIREMTRKLDISTSDIKSIEKNMPEIINQSTPQVLYKPLTAFANQNTIISTAVQQDTKTFKYIYTINAQISYKEYNKLLNIINMLQEQKRKWELEVDESKDKLEKIGREKMQLAHNNHILRQSLEAANRAIKEIKGKVQELKQTLVPLREENLKLKEELDKKSDKVASANSEKMKVLNELHEFKRIKLTLEETISFKETEMEEYQKTMHEKFRKLEEAYRNYKDDIEKTNLSVNQENAELKEVNRSFGKDMDKIRSENTHFKKEINILNVKIAELSDQNKDLEKQLVTLEQSDDLAAKNEELEALYLKKIDDMRDDLLKIKEESEKLKTETYGLESENDKLKTDLKVSESRISDLIKDREMQHNQHDIEKQHNEILKNEIQELRKEMENYRDVKDINIDLSENVAKYKEELEGLKLKLKELENLKIENTNHENENQKLKAEIEMLFQRAEDSEKSKEEELKENEKLKIELNYLQKQLTLLEDKQNAALQNPLTEVVKIELESLRNQMKHLVDNNQEQRLRLYNDELKRELEGLRTQIKDLDNSTRESSHSSVEKEKTTLIRESNNTTMIQNNQQLLERMIIVRDHQDNKETYHGLNKRDGQNSENDSKENVPNNETESVPKGILAQNFHQNTRQENDLITTDSIDISEESLTEVSEVDLKKLKVNNTEPVTLHGNDEVIDEIVEPTNVVTVQELTLAPENPLVPQLPKRAIRQATEIKEHVTTESIEIGNKKGAVPNLVENISSKYERQPLERTAKNAPEITRKHSTESLDERQIKLKKIEDKIKQKRSQSSMWSLKTPSIEKLQRQSNESLDLADAKSQKSEHKWLKQRERSQSGENDRSRPSSTQRPRSLDRKRIEPSGKTGSAKPERGRSPKRKGYRSNEETDLRNRKVNNVEQNGKGRYPIVEIKVDNSAKQTSDGHQYMVYKQQTEVTEYTEKGIIQNTRKNDEESRLAVKSGRLSRERRKRSEERRKERLRSNRDRLSDETSDEGRDTSTGKTRRPRGRSFEKLERSEKRVNSREPDMLLEAMKSRQEQATTKKSGLRPMKFKDEIDKNALLILQKHEEKRSRRYAENSKTQPQQRQHFPQQQKQKQQKGVHLKQLHIEKTQQSNQQRPNMKQKTPDNSTRVLHNTNDKSHQKNISMQQDDRETRQDNRIRQQKDVRYTANIQSKRTELISVQEAEQHHKHEILKEENATHNHVGSGSVQQMHNQHSSLLHNSNSHEATFPAHENIQNIRDDESVKLTLKAVPVKTPESAGPIIAQQQQQQIYQETIEGKMNGVPYSTKTNSHSMKTTYTSSNQNSMSSTVGKPRTGNTILLQNGDSISVKRERQLINNHDMRKQHDNMTATKTSLFVGETIGRQQVSQRTSTNASHKQTPANHARGMNTAEIAHASDSLYATVNKSSKLNGTHRILTEAEKEDIRRMEIVRQKLLKKQENSSDGEERKDSQALATKQAQDNRTKILTIGGKPVRSRSNSNNSIVDESFITETKQNGAVLEHENQSQIVEQNENKRYGFSSEHKYEKYRENHHTSTIRSENRAENRNRTLPHKMKPLQQSISEQIIQSGRNHRSAETLTQKNVEYHESHQSRSYRNMKLHEYIQRKQRKSPSSFDSSKRMSNDSLGGHSQLTFTTLSDGDSRQYDDYATQIDDYQENRSNASNTALYGSQERYVFDESEILSVARNIPKGHSNFKCDKCRELNMRRKVNEPVQYCWERYYPISETTPGNSLLSLVQN